LWSCGSSAADEQHAEPVVVSVAETTGDWSMGLDETVDGLCAAVAEELASPGQQRPAEAREFRDRAGRTRLEDPLG